MDVVSPPGAVKLEERSLTETPTWAVAVVCFVLLVISIIIEHIIHHIGSVRLLNFFHYIYAIQGRISLNFFLLSFLVCNEFTSGPSIDFPNCLKGKQ